MARVNHVHVLEIFPRITSRFRFSHLDKVDWTMAFAFHTKLNKAYETVIANRQQNLAEQCVARVVKSQLL